MDNVQNISRCLGKSGAWSVVENGQLATVAKPGWLEQLWNVITTGSFIRPSTDLAALSDHIINHLSSVKIDTYNATGVTEIRDALVELKGKAKSKASKESLERAIQSLSTPLNTWRAEAEQDPAFTKLNLWCYGDVKVTREKAEAFAQKKESKDLVGLGALLNGRQVGDNDLGKIARRLATEQLLNQKGTSLEKLKEEGRITEEECTRLQKGYVQLLEERAPSSKSQFTVRINFP